MLDIYETFSTLAGVYGPSGREYKIAEIIKDIAAPFVDEVSVDTMGNLIAHKCGNGKKIMAAAHMDTLGFAATFIDDNGFIRFSPVGGLTVLGIANSRVIFENGAVGTVCCDETVNQGDLTMNDFYIDIGAKDKSDAESKVSTGDFAAFHYSPILSGDTIFSAYLDNRIGCTALLCALSVLKKNDNDIYAVFSTQEEVGTRGAAAAAFDLKPDCGIAIDVTDTGDVPGKKVSNCVKLGAGPAVKLMDSSLIASGKMIAALRSAAEQSGISCQNDIIVSGGTDAGVIQKARDGVFTGGISIPCRYMHSPCEEVRLSDVHDTSRVIAEFLAENIL